jgi:integration host factor subunit alpha
LTFQRDISPGAGQAMTGKTITRADLCEAVYKMVGLSRTESASFVVLVLK